MSDEADNTSDNTSINTAANDAANVENAPLEDARSPSAADEGAVPVGGYSHTEPFELQSFPPLPPPLPPPFPYRRPPLDWPSFRTPNFADFGLFMGLLILGFLVASGAVGMALYFHWFGLRNFNDVQNSTGVSLGTQVLIYLVALVVAIPFFRAVWGRGFFDGIHWHFATAFRLRYRLVWTAVLCNVIAMLGNAFLPFPQHAPIDKLFGTSNDAWMLMAFGVTVAPFFEEMIFRGFLMPALATAWDWFAERSTGSPPRPLDAAGNPVWSGFAAVFAAMTASVPFAWMHSEQVGRAWGPLLLLYCVSLILCTVRLVTRSLAASTLTHSAYNFLLFAMMFWQTGGFRHMDKM